MSLSSVANFKLSSDSDFGLINNGVGTAGSELFSKESNIADIDITTFEGAQEAISALDTAIAHVDSLRSMLGAVQNRFGASINNLASAHENVSGARSRLMDAEFSKETAELTKLQVTQQATTALMSQAFSLQDQAIRLLG